MTTQETNPIAYARGVLQVESETYRRQRDQVVATLEYLLAALESGAQWEIDAAVHGATLTVASLKDKP